MRNTLLAIVTLSGLAACEWNSDKASADASTQPRPDVHVNPDIDADVDAEVTITGHLLLTEVAMQPTGGEFVEITNPTAATISLADYYVSDTGDYWKLPAGVPVISASDYIVTFPLTATIAAGASITVATGTSAAFMTAYGMAPTYSIADGNLTRTDGGTVTPSHTDAGEIFVLFYWDRTKPLVKDVDMMIVGTPTSTNGLVTKSGVVFGSGTYATDANTIQSQLASPGNGVSTKRKLAETGHETQGGAGNGIGGDDETSEDTRMTWDSTYTAPTPNAAPTF